jgi:hypothetical protein
MIFANIFKELFQMKKMVIYEPAMRCSTGLCGASVDTELIRISTVLDIMKKNGIEHNYITIQKINEKFKNICYGCCPDQRDHKKKY